MIGRTDELELLDSLYLSDKFEFLVMYGGKGVGKTTILQEFAKNRNVIFPGITERYMHAKEDGAILLGIDDLYDP